MAPGAKRSWKMGKKLMRIESGGDWPWYRLDLWLALYPYQWLRYSLPYRLRWNKQVKDGPWDEMSL